MPIKFLLLGGGGGFVVFLEGGGVKCEFYFYGRGDFFRLEKGVLSQKHHPHSPVGAL